MKDDNLSDSDQFSDNVSCTDDERDEDYIPDSQEKNVKKECSLVKKALPIAVKRKLNLETSNGSSKNQETKETIKPTVKKSKKTTMKSLTALTMKLIKTMLLWRKNGKN